MIRFVLRPLASVFGAPDWPVLSMGLVLLFTAGVMTALWPSYSTAEQLVTITMGGWGGILVGLGLKLEVGMILPGGEARLGDVRPLADVERALIEWRALENHRRIESKICYCCEHPLVDDRGDVPEAHEDHCPWLVATLKLMERGFTLDALLSGRIVETAPARTPSAPTRCVYPMCECPTSGPCRGA